MSRFRIAFLAGLASVTILAAVSWATLPQKLVASSDVVTWLRANGTEYTLNWGCYRNT